MAGKIHAMIEKIIDQRSGGSNAGAAAVRVRLLLRGIDPDKYDATSDDDPVIIAKLDQMATDFDGGTPPTMGGAR